MALGGNEPANLNDAFYGLAAFDLAPLVPRLRADRIP
jgi:hypothetical protein